MTDLNDPKIQALARTIDYFVTLDLTGLGLVVKLAKALKERQEGPMCLGAAKLMLDALPERGGVAIIATGFPMGGGVPETDGPVGAALLARALLLARGVLSVIVIDEEWVDCLKAACIGAGLSPMALPDTGVQEIGYLRQVYIKTLPRSVEAAHAKSDRLLDRLKPHLMVATERPGKNDRGSYHGLNGRNIDGFVADVDYLFAEARKRGVPFVGVGDGGNELGMGLIKDALPEFMPQAADCGCPCGGGVAADMAADFLVVGTVSNWGVTGIIAALTTATGRMEVFHEPDQEFRAIELCANAGAVDGVSVSPIPAVDGIPALEWSGLVRAMRGIVRRGMELTADWRRTPQKDMK